MDNVTFETDIQQLAERAKADHDFAQRLYAALCNMQWCCKDGAIYSCTWRYAGGLVAELRDEGEGYMDFYCSGNEGCVADDVKAALANLGWTPLPYPVHSESVLDGKED